MKIFIFLLFAFSAMASDYMIEGMTVAFVEKDGLNVRGCDKDCEALKSIKAHKKISLSEVRKSLKFVGAIGSDVCHETYQAKSLLGREVESKDQRAFCLFKDGSMVEINSLTEYLTKNKIVR